MSDPSTYQTDPNWALELRSGGVEITPIMLKAAWVEARRWWPRKVVETVPCEACGQTKGFRIIETSIHVDEPQPGFAEAIKAALAAGVAT